MSVPTGTEGKILITVVALIVLSLIAPELTGHTVGDSGAVRHGSSAQRERDALVRARHYASALGADVQPVPGDGERFIVWATRQIVDPGLLGTVVTENESSATVLLPTGARITLYWSSAAGALLRGVAAAPDANATVPLTPERKTILAQQFSANLGVPVGVIAGEVNQFSVEGTFDAVDLLRIGRIHTIAGTNVGLTLPDGTHVGFRFEGSAPSTPLPTDADD